ncbi:MAG: hypothetical protein LBK98_08105 [Peptococcaceae bacterium]|jgi:hypothetical protein|nr:hypothetical protein [Peptococcaceae bacterium]
MMTSRKKTRFLKRLGAACLALALVLSAAPFSIFAETAGPGGQGLAAGLYSVPLTRSSPNGYYSKSPLGTSTSGRYIQIHDRALVEVKEDGACEITLQVYGYQPFKDTNTSFVQVIDPAQAGTSLRNYLETIGHTGDFRYMPYGGFNIPAAIKNAPLAQYGASGLNIVNEATFWTGEVDEFYLPAASVTAAAGTSPLDQALDQGYITVKLPQADLLSEPLLINYYARDLQIKHSSHPSATKFSALAVWPEPDQAMPLPAELTGDAALAYSWTNDRDGADPRFSTSKMPAWTAPTAYAGLDIGKLFEAEVPVSQTPEGKLTATFTLRSPYDDDGNNVLTIERGISKDVLPTDAPYNDNYWVPASGITFEDINLEDGVFALTFDDLAFGIPLRVRTTKHAEKWSYYGYLRLDTEPITDETLSDNGVSLFYKSNALPTGSALTAASYAAYSESLPYVTPESFLINASGAASGKYLFYALNLAAADEPAGLKAAATLRVPIPDGWDMDRLLIKKWLGEDYTIDQDGLASFKRLVIDKENRYVEILWPASDPINTTFFIGEKYAPVTDLADSTKEDGLYRAAVFLKHYGQDRVSMGNSAINRDSDPYAYIETRGGERTLYLGLQSILALSLQNYISDLFYYDTGDKSGVRTPVETLSYFTPAEIDDADGGFATSFGLNYPKRVAIPLRFGGEEDVFWLHLFIPIMDAFSGSEPGSGDSSQDTRLLITAVEKIAGENPVNPYGDYDKSVLDVKIRQAEKAAATLGATGQAILLPALDTAREVYQGAPASDEIAAARDALALAIARATAAPEAVSKAKLTAKLAAAAAYLPDAYTESSYAALANAISAAQLVLADEDAEQGAVDAQVAGLTTAINNLVPRPAAPSADTAALEAAIYGAKQLSATAAVYEDTSWRALTATVEAAETALKSAGLTQEKADTQVVSLGAAIDALAAQSELRVRVDGEVSLSDRTALWNYSTWQLFHQLQPSMGNAAINHSLSKAIIGENGGELRLFFGPLTTMGFTGYLQSLAQVSQIHYDETGDISGWDTTPATVYSGHTGVTDAYGPPAGTSYPYEVGIPINPGEPEITLEVFVPIMDAISQGSGTQLAILRIDWDGIDLSGGSAVADLTTLTAALDQAADAAGGNGDGYTPVSYAALTASVEAGQWLNANNEILTVTQAMADSRAAAILAAIEALLPETAVTVTLPSAVTGDTAAVTVTDGIISGALTAVGDAAAGETVGIKLDITAGTTGTDTADVAKVVLTIDAAAAKAIAQAAQAGESGGGAKILLTVANPVGAVTLDNAAILAAIQVSPDSGGGAVAPVITLSLEKIDLEKTDESAFSAVDLSETQQRLISGKAAIYVEILADDAIIDDFGAGTAEVALPYAPVTDTRRDRLRVFRLGANAGVSIPGSRYDAPTGAMIFALAAPARA